MHQFLNSASPYLCEIKIDTAFVFKNTDINLFMKSIQQGVAVFGHTPNVIVKVEGGYKYWDSLVKLVEKLDTGKVAVCSHNCPENLGDILMGTNNTVLVKIFAGSDIDLAKNWILS